MTDLQPDAPISFYDRPLYQLLNRTFADSYRTKSGQFDVKAFAKSIGFSHEGVYKWLRSDKLSAQGAKKIVEMSVGEIKIEDMTRFVLA